MRSEACSREEKKQGKRLERAAVVLTEKEGARHSLMRIAAFGYGGKGVLQ